MLIEKNFTVKNSVERVWDLLLDVEKLGSCVPGLEKLEVNDDDNFRIVAKTKVGIVPAKFDVEFKITKKDRLVNFEFVGRGKDILTKSTLTLINVLKLRATSNGQTEISYKADLCIGGRFATFGQRVVTAKAKQLEDEFINCLIPRLSMI
ncbi:MAG: CoxG family protein [Candidatus Bathyarchaeia archaeon]